MQPRGLNMIKFPAELFLEYMGELLRVNPTEAYEFSNPSVLSDVDEFLNHPKDDWDVLDIDPLHLWELAVQEAILNNRFLHIANNSDDPAVVENFAVRYWSGDFGISLFDPVPDPHLSLMGWINHNFSRQYEMKFDKLPPTSLHGITRIASMWLDKSPTYDELLNEHIVSVLAEIREDSVSTDESEFLSDFETPDDWLNETGNDLIYESTKVMYQSIHYLVDSATLGVDTIVGDVALVIISELRDDYVGTVIEELGVELASITPINIISNMLDIVEHQINEQLN